MTSLSTAPESGGARWPIGLIAIAAVIPLISVMMVSSAGRDSFPDLWYKQLLWSCAGFVVAAVVARARPSSLELGAFPLYALVCVLLVAVLVMGTPHKGAQRWLDIGPIGGQPSELAKIAIILVVAKYFGEYEVPGGYTLMQLLRPFNVSRPLGLMAGVVWRHFHQIKKHDLDIAKGVPLEELHKLQPHWVTAGAIVIGGVWLMIAILATVRGGISHRKIVAPIDIVLVPFALVLIEPDLGTASIVLAIAATQILFCGMRPRDLAISFVGAISTAVFAWFFVLQGYQKKRVQTFLNPEADIQGAGYHAAQSIIAVGSGQITGKGYGQGTQTQLSFLPENHTDFIFSVLGEEWGFVGAVVLIVLFFTLIALMLRGARKATDRFSALIAVGAASMIFWHAFINMGMVTGVLPVVGVTLPLMSYGGSSMITKMIAIGFAVNAQVGRKT